MRKRKSFVLEFGWGVFFRIVSISFMSLVLSKGFFLVGRKRKGMGGRLRSTIFYLIPLVCWGMMEAKVRFFFALLFCQRHTLIFFSLSFDWYVPYHLCMCFSRTLPSFGATQCGLYDGRSVFLEWI